MVFSILFDFFLDGLDRDRADLGKGFTPCAMNAF
jgi:hypothetical protein